MFGQERFFDDVGITAQQNRFPHCQMFSKVCGQRHDRAIFGKLGVGIVASHCFESFAKTESLSSAPRRHYHLTSVKPNSKDQHL